MAYYVMVKNPRGRSSQVAVSFAVEGLGAGFGKIRKRWCRCRNFEYLWAVLAGRENYLDE